MARPVKDLSAGEAYNDKAKELFGEFAKLNRIEGGDNRTV